MSTLSKKLVKSLVNPGYGLSLVAKKYINYYNGYSYDFAKNGESELLTRMAALRPTLVFDVGANVGDWSAIAAEKFPGAIVHCFEISKKTFQTLGGHLKGPRFKLNNFGLSNESGTLRYKDYGQNSGVNTIILDATYHDDAVSHALVEAPIKSGFDYCQENSIDFIDFIKIDVEGAEHLVIMGFEELLAKKMVRAIQFEYGYTNGDSRFLMRDFYHLFEKHGYIVGRIRRGGVSFRGWMYQDNDFTSGPNYLAVRKDDDQLIGLLSN
jgi:FkbM family methyltransferase